MEVNASAVLKPAGAHAVRPINSGRHTKNHTITQILNTAIVRPSRSLSADRIHCRRTEIQSSSRL